MNRIDWEQLAAFLTVATIIGGAAMFFVRRWLGSLFVRHEDVRGIARRVAELEQAGQKVPGADEFRALDDRVRKVETAVEVLQSAIIETRDGVKRVEHQLDLLIKHALKVGT